MAIFHKGQRLTDGMNVDMTVERVGNGGFGEVAIGPDQLDKERWVAIKVLRPDLLARRGYQPGTAAYDAAAERLRASFLEEALTWRGLWPHPNLLAAQFVVLINGQLMLALDYAEQGSLRDYFDDLRRRGSWLTLDSALRLAQQIAAGLVALHTPAPDLLRPDPIVHRDLNPNNILLSDGYALITDFGLAKAVTEATRAYPAQQHGPVGTPPYIAPEQWQDASQVGTAADAYAFGLIVAELLTGRHPLLSLDDPRLTLADCRQAHLAGRPMPLRQLGADVFADERAQHDADWGKRQQAALEQVERLVARLLAKQEAARPTLVEALAGLQAAAVTLGEQPSYTPPEAYPPTAERQTIFWLGWANAYQKFGFYDEALLRIERALQLAPEDPDVLVAYANILHGLGRGEEALAVERQALGRLPEDDHQGRAVVWTHSGSDLMQRGRYAEAEAVFAQALTLAPTDAGAWAMRAANEGAWAQAEQAAGQVGSARVHVEAGLAHIAQALRLDPDHSTYRQVAQMLLQHRERLRRQG